MNFPRLCRKNEAMARNTASRLFEKLKLEHGESATGTSSSTRQASRHFRPDLNV